MSLESDPPRRAKLQPWERVPDAVVGAVFDAHAFGLRTLRAARGERYRPHVRRTARRRAVAQAILDHDGDFAFVASAARNLVLSAHHRGENAQKVEYLTIDFAMRRVESYGDLYDGPDDDFAAELARNMERSRKATEEQERKAAARRPDPGPEYKNWTGVEIPIEGFSPSPGPMFED